ncbi:PEGA domain-containing protein, partial [Xanthomonadaceae bacterium JHOS43]|nr:PEGA domain-containing protein [Xanthomonadaceae bacterium JHOS43]
AALAEQAAHDVVAEVVQSGRFERPAVVQVAAPAMVQVAVTSTPPGADIEVDGIFYGNAGGTVSLPQGLRTVHISLAGYLPWEKKVMVSSGVTISARLAPVQ